MKRIRTTCLFVFFAVYIWAQPSTKSIDSLKQVVSTTNVETVKYNSWLQLSQLYLQFDTSLSLTYLHIGLDNARLQKNILYETEFLSQLGTLHFTFENNDSALYYLTACTSKFDNGTPPRLMFECYIQLGNAYWKNGDFQKSMQALLKAENYANPPDEALKRSQLYYTMGGVMMDLQQPEKALEYCKKCITVLEQNNLTQHLSKNYSSCGALFFMLGKPAEALALFNKGLALAIKFSDTKSYTQATMNLGNYYNEMDNLDSALYFYNLSRIAHLKSTHTDQQYASLLLNIASVLDQQKKYNEAEL
ncbi:MAG TPA: tetratricopeptide repeat protein, partial [Bacteroidia bacterium]|nr:tetratricopeptide repeat protein [Bacteroidia bacterium]